MKRNNFLERERTFNILNPIQNSEKEGIFKLSKTSLEKYKSNLYTLIFTGIGERVMFPHFGTRIRQLLFGPIDINIEEKIENEIRRASNYWIPEIRIIDVEIKNPEETFENNMISIVIHFSLTLDESIQDKIELEFGV